MILITGITGLLGAHLAATLIMNNQKVRGFARASSKKDVLQKVFSYYQIEDRLSEIDWKIGELSDIFSIEEALAGIDTCYHSAAMVSFAPQDKNEMMKINVEGTTNMVNAALYMKTAKFCFVSSTAAFGVSHNTDIITEKINWKNSPYNSNYAISKYLSEKEVWRAYEEGLNTVIVNPSIILGPGNWESGSGNIFKTCSKGLKFYTEGSNGFVDVRDVVNMMISLCEKEKFGEKYIISGHNLKLKELFGSIQEKLGVAQPTIKAGKFATEIAWRWEWLKSLIIGNKPLITKETVRNAHLTRNYDNSKSVKDTGLNYRMMEDTIDYNCQLFLKDFPSK